MWLSRLCSREYDQQRAAFEDRLQQRIESETNPVLKNKLIWRKASIMSNGMFFDIFVRFPLCWLLELWGKARRSCRGAT